MDRESLFKAFVLRGRAARECLTPCIKCLPTACASELAMPRVLLERRPEYILMRVFSGVR